MLSLEHYRCALLAFIRERHNQPNGEGIQEWSCAADMFCNTGSAAASSRIHMCHVAGKYLHHAESGKPDTEALVMLRRLASYARSTHLSKQQGHTEFTHLPSFGPLQR